MTRQEALVAFWAQVGPLLAALVILVAVCVVGASLTLPAEMVRLRAWWAALGEEAEKPPAVDRPEVETLP